MSLTIRNTTDQLEETEQRVTATLDAHAEDIGHPFVAERFSLEAWDGDTYLGGLIARMVQEWVFLALLSVTDAARGRGIGRELIAALEDTAREKGATGIWLDTFSFQAPDFYRKLGYEEFGHLPDSPAGYTRYFFRKRLDG